MLSSLTLFSAHAQKDQGENAVEESKDDLRDVRMTVQPATCDPSSCSELLPSLSLEIGGKTYSDALSSTGLGYAAATRNHNVGAIPHVLTVQAKSDCHSSIPPKAVLRDITTYITMAEDCSVTRGGFGQIWRCTYRRDQRPIEVAVKVLLAYTSDQFGTIEKRNKRIRHEVRKCAKLTHRNILPVYGYTYGFGILVAIVTHWAENGNLTTYLEHEDTTLNVVSRFHLLKDITAGLQYLHANNMTHGALNGPNVLIYGDGTACLADCGLSQMYSEVTTTSAPSWTYAFHGNVQWLAPELLGDLQDKSPVRPTKHSDIYSFGGIMLHVLTSKIPYHYLDEAAVIQRITTGIKPLRSHYPTVCDKYWRFIKICWSDATQTRPSAEEVIEWIIDELDLLASSGADS